MASRIARLPPKERAKWWASLTEAEAKHLQFDWKFWARKNQLPPKAPYLYWLLLAGRGFGKTRVGSEETIRRVQHLGHRRIALVAETAADARDVMVEGDSGILACSPPWFYPKYEPSKRRLTWPNGARATTYSADEPGQLRGPQHDFAWADELAKWRYEDAWDQLQFGLRLGNDPCAVITTTPKPTIVVKSILADVDTYVTRGSTFENRGNLAGSFLKKIREKYEGTRLGRQELFAEVLDDAPGALWKRDLLEENRLKLPLRKEGWPPSEVIRYLNLIRIVVAVDPSVSANAKKSATGIIVAGLSRSGHGYILADDSIDHPTPEEWGKAAVEAYIRWGADRIVGEVNNGGDLVEANIRLAARVAKREVSYKAVHASKGKAIRAEPVAALAEQHKVHHVGLFAYLEDELTTWEPGVSPFSPNRLDAKVWAITELMVGDMPTAPVATTIKTKQRMPAGRGY